MAAKVSAARYGKEHVRVCKVHRDPKTGMHAVIEMTVSVLLEGDIDVSYTHADNSVVVATDSMKNAVYILAKQHPVTPPELFASIVADHFVQTYSHIHVAHVNVAVHRWTRISVDGKPHPHSFQRDGSDIRVVDASVVEGKGVDIKSSASGLRVFKSTNSEFHGFIRDEYTTLPETWDRILSTELDSVWHWTRFSGLEQVKAAVAKFDAAWDAVRDISLRTFANEKSASVQNTMYKMAQDVLAFEPLVATVDYSLPNKHYFQLDLSWYKGLKNTGKDAEVYLPGSGASGLIQCSVSRSGGGQASKL